MKKHIEYDDFGEFEEYLVEEADGGSFTVEERKAASAVRTVFQKLLLTIAAVTIVLGTSSYAAEAGSGETGSMEVCSVEDCGGSACCPSAANGT